MTPGLAQYTTGWVRQGSNNYASTETAIQCGWVKRHHDLGCIALGDDRGSYNRMKASTAIELGFIDAKAAAAVAALPDCIGQPARPPYVYGGQGPRGPAYLGTPAEPVVKALLALLVDRGSVERAEAFAEALNEALATR